MMKLITTLNLFIIFSFTLPNSSFSSSYIYEEDSNLLIGGYPVEILRYKLEKNTNFNLKDEIFVSNEKKHHLLINSKYAIEAYGLSSKGFLAVSSSKVDNQLGILLTSLSIYSRVGKLIKAIENVPVRDEIKYFSWSNDGSKIAYIKGKSFLERRDPFIKEGVFIYNSENNENIKISAKGAKVNWSNHDNNIYIQNQFDYIDPTDISVYDTQKRKLTKSKSKGIIFSDDGKYCIGTVANKVKDNEGVNFKHYIYDNLTNEIIYKFKEKHGVQSEITKNLKFIKGTHYLLMWQGLFYKVFDVNTKKNIRIAKRQGLLGWNKDMTKAVVYEGGNQVHIDEILTGKRLQSIDLPKK